MLQKINRIIERCEILFSSTESLRKRWPEAPKLTDQHISNCRLSIDRIQMLNRIPKGGVYAELGIFKCNFSDEIYRKLEPEKLHLIDIAPESIQIAKAKFTKEISSGKIEVHLGDSSQTLLSLEEILFDWIYIDGDHNYEGVKRDLDAAYRKLKPDGLISLNDYIYFGPSDITKYGVIEAVNEFCIDYNFEIIDLALQGRMYNDVTIRRKI